MTNTAVAPTTTSPEVDTATCNVCEHQVRREITACNRDWRCSEKHPRCTMIGCIPRQEARP